MTGEGFFEVKFEGREIEIRVEFDYDPGSPSSGHYGPPEDYDPGSGPEIDGLSAFTLTGEPFVLSNEEEATILEKLHDDPDKYLPADDGYDESEDYRHDD